MSFTLNRNNKLVVRKNITVNTVPNPANVSASIGSTGITKIASLTTLSLNNTPISVEPKKINKLNVTAGIAEPEKALVLDANKDITSLNRIDCNILIAGGQNITASMFQSNLNLINTTIGIGSANKALILDETKNIDNINTLSINTLITNNNKIISGTNNSTIKLQTIHNVIPNFQNLNTEYKSITQYQRISTVGTNSTRFNTLNWNSICWSPELSLFVMVANGFVSGTTAPNGVRVAISKDGYNWTMITTIDNDWQDIIWISKLRLFVAVSSSGTGNRIMTSPDGINWTARNSTGDYNWVQLCWAPELNLCLAINTNNGFIMYSNDCINWFMTQTDSTNAGLKKICWANELNLFVAITNTNSANSFLVSSNGINWNAINSINTSGIWHDIQWSPYLKMFLVSSQFNSLNNISYSYDGYNWFNSYQNANITTFVWADNLHLWIGFNRLLNERILYSSDGKHWLDFIIETDVNKATFNKIIWSNELGILVCCMSSTSNTITKRIITIQPNIVGNKPSLIFNKNIIHQDLINNRLGIKTYTPNRPLEINSEAGKVLRLYSDSGTFSSNFNLTNNGQLNIDANIVNILTDYSTYGLKLNGTLINTSVDILNNISANTSVKIADSNKIIEFDSTRDITNLNILSCNSLTVNGVAQEGSNNAYFQNSVVGTVIGNSAILTDSNNNIDNFNNISLKTYNVNNTLLNSDKLNDKIHFNNMNKKKNNDRMKKILLSSSAWGISDFNTISEIIWVNKLKSFITVQFSSTFLVERIKTSQNGLTWTNRADNISDIQGRCVCWSPELELCVIGFGNGILKSSDLISWDGVSINGIDAFNDVFHRIIWASKLNLFIGATNNSSANVTKFFISANGLKWTLVKTISTSTTNRFCWAPELSLCLYVFNSTTLYISSDGYTWSLYTLPSNISVSYISWSSDLRMFISTGNSNTYYYSYDGYIWHKNTFPGSITGSSSLWISELKLFIVSGGAVICYSNDGKNWDTYTTTGNLSYPIWAPELKKILFLTSSETSAYHLLFPTDFNYNNTTLTQTNTIQVNQSNGFVGLGGISPTFQLQLAIDSAAKPTSSTWTVSSDERLKEDISLANLELCYNNFKNLNLVKYKWKDSNKEQLGWIAQQIESVFPKAITTCSYKNINDCKFLNNDQINATLYGALQYVMNDIDQQETTLLDITNSLNDIENTLNSLVIE